MNECTKFINQLSDRVQDVRRSNASLYLIAMAIAHGEGTATDYSDSLSLLYEVLAEQISDVQRLIGEINERITRQEEIS